MSRVKIKNDPDTILCDKCPKRETCKKLCPAMCRELQKENQVMEKFCSDRIEVYPSKVKEIQFSSLKDDHFQSGKTHQKTEDDFSEPFPWATRDHRLRKTTVFIERFFNKTPCRELAERFGVKENTIVYMYKQAVEQLDKIISIMDARKEGIKSAMVDNKFTDAEKMFLLTSVFGFTQREVGEMFKTDRNVVRRKIKRMTDKYQAAFASSYEGQTTEQINRRMIHG